MPFVTVDVDVDLDEFKDDDLLKEVKMRGLLNNDEVDLVEIARESGALIFQPGISEPYMLSVNNKSSFSSTGKATIIILEGI